MSEYLRYRLGPDVPDEEELLGSQGRVVDETSIDAAVDEAREQTGRRAAEDVHRAN